MSEDCGMATECFCGNLQGLQLRGGTAKDLPFTWSARLVTYPLLIGMVRSTVPMIAEISVE